MARNSRKQDHGASRGPSLPTRILKRISAPLEDAPDVKPFRRSRTDISLRKEKRKEQRLNHKHVPSKPRFAKQYPVPNSEDSTQRAYRGSDGSSPGKIFSHRELPHSGGKDEFVSDEEFDLDLETDGDSSDDELNDDPKRADKKSAAKVDADDAEIADLEKKLGISSRKRLPQSFRDEGLGDILGDLEAEGDDSEEVERKKRKVEADEWLASKRRKSTAVTIDSSQLLAQPRKGSTVEHGRGEAATKDQFSTFDSEDDQSLSDSNGDEDEDGFEAAQPRRVRENPYIAPRPTEDGPKYIPPARRRDDGSDAELLLRIKRQLQGYINRLTEVNLVNILGDVEKMYQSHARQHVTSVLVDLLLVQICEPAALPDTLIILIAGFSTAVYKVIGADFGAQLVQQAVNNFDAHYKHSLSIPVADAPKQTANIVTLFAELYNFQTIGCNIVFDYVRFFLDDLSELNAELLLRIVRISGLLMRQDDPLALKDIVTMIRPAVAKIGESNLSVRTKFMIETINDLKNNKLKAGAAASAITTEHTTRMKKTLGTLNSRRLKSTEPLRVGLNDLRDSDKKGKWWLVGASWSGNGAPDNTNTVTTAPSGQMGSGGGDLDDENSLSDNGADETLDLMALAKDQRMNTNVRRSIFIAIMSATDCEDAYVRLLKLRLNKDRQREAANVIVQCAGSEQQYNPYYTLIARRLCVDKKIRYAFQSTLWELFRKLGETVFGEADDPEADDEDNDNDEQAVTMRRIVNLGKLFGSLIASGVQGLSILKCLDLTYLGSDKTKAFVEVMLINLFKEVEKQMKDASVEITLSKIFGQVAEMPELSRGLKTFLRKVVLSSDLISGKRDRRLVAQHCKIAQRALKTKTMVDDAR